jgi:hypothetical protein
VHCHRNKAIRCEGLRARRNAARLDVCQLAAKPGSSHLPRVANDALAGVARRDVGEFALEGGRRRPAVCVAVKLKLIDPIWNDGRRQSLSFGVNKETEVTKITTIVLATALAISSGYALAAGASTGGTAAHGAAGTVGGSSGVRAGVSPGAAPSTTPGTTTGMGIGAATGVPATPGLNANGPCNGASSTTRGGAC